MSWIDKTMPLVSVIIPCYNAERFLDETIKSVIGQSFANYEIIVVDDGSTDRTAEIIQSFSDRVIAVFSPNRGASAARNLGTLMAKGEFFQYLDADDLLRQDALMRRIEALQSSHADVAYSDWQRLKETKYRAFKAGETISRAIEDVHHDPQIACFTSFWAPPAALLYRRAIVEKIGGWNESLPIVQDARFLFDAALVGGKFVHVSEIGADYRILNDDSSLSRCNVSQFVRDVYHNACEIELIWRGERELDKDQRLALANVYNYTTRHLFTADFELFRESFMRLQQTKAGISSSWNSFTYVLSSIVGQKLASLVLRMLGKYHK